MSRSWLILAGAVFVGAAHLTFAQTIPPRPPREKLRRDIDRQARNVLDNDESALRIKEAGELFRAGALSEAVAKLRGDDFIVRFDCDANRHQIAIAQALLALADGDWRSASDEADLVYADSPVSRDNKVDAALAKSLVLLKANIIPPALHYANWVDEVSPGNNGAAGIRKRVANANLGTFTRVAQTDHPWHPGFRMDLWRGSEGAVQPLAVTFRGESRLVAALTVEKAATAEGEPAEFVVVLRDLEAPPLVLKTLGRSIPDEDAFQEFAEQFCPAWGGGRFSVLREEAESLCWRERGVTPFAAQWAAYALEGGSRVAKDLQAELHGSNAWRWKLRKTDRQGDWSLRVYRNQDVPSSEESKDDQQPCEHVCLAVSSSDNDRFSSCYVVCSKRLLSGDLIFYLERREDDRREVLDLYDHLPKLGTATKNVVRHLLPR